MSWADKVLIRRTASPAPQGGWSAQQLRMPASWYDELTLGCGVEFPVSGDETARKSKLLNFVREALGIELMPWQERLLIQRGPYDTPRTARPEDP